MTNDSLRLHDADRFRRSAATVCEMVADWLGDTLDPQRRQKLYQQLNPGAMLEAWTRALPADGVADIEATTERFVGRMLTESHRVMHPRSVGHQMAPTVPELALVELAISLLNNSTAIHEMAPAASAIEYDLVRRLGEQVGYDPAVCGGILTHGGSLGNLVGLLAARRVRGLASKPFAVLVSDQAHYCIERSMYVMNQPREHVFTIPVDDRFRMRPEELEDAASKAEAADLPILAVVATAVSTPTGAIDPLDACASFCEERDLWLHIDGAHGASLAFGIEGRRRLGRGLARANSIVWDAHKMMLTHALCTALLFRDARHADGTFQQDASYLFGDANQEREADLDHGLRTIETTKPAIAFRWRALFDLVGTNELARVIDGRLAIAQAFTDMLAEHPRFEPLLLTPEANIVCFRLVDQGGSPRPDSDQDAARNRLIAEGRFYITRTRLKGSVWLRSTIMHPETTIDDLRALLEELR